AEISTGTLPSIVISRRASVFTKAADERRAAADLNAVQVKACKRLSPPGSESTSGARRHVRPSLPFFQRLQRLLVDRPIPLLVLRKIPERNLPVCDRILAIADRRVSAREPDKRDERIVGMQFAIQPVDVHRLFFSARRDERSCVAVNR